MDGNSVKKLLRQTPPTPAATPRQATSDNEPQIWPSERVAQGGMFHQKKIEYSKETADLLQLLMQESKMSMLMRKQINYHLRNGEPLPKPEPPKVRFDPDFEAMEILRRARMAKRRSLQKVIASGAYDKTLYRPTPDGRMPTEKAKKLLQEAMSGMLLSDSTLKAKRRPRPKNEFHVTDEDIIKELLEQIDERADWLVEMEEIGEGKKYRQEIQGQIAERLRQIKAIETKLQLSKEGFRIVN